MNEPSPQTPRRPALRVALTLVVLALLAAACSGGADTAGEAGSGSASPAATAAADAPAESAGGEEADPPATGATSDSGSDAPEDGGDASGGDTVTLDDPYSQQLREAAGQTVDTSQFKKEPPYRIATIVQGPTNGWGTIFDTVMNYQLEQSGMVEDLLYVPWDFTTESQANGIDDAISRGVDAILLTSLSRAGLAAPVERATAEGIPVITCMAGVETDAYTVEVSRNIPQMGYDSAKALAEELGGQGRVVLLHGIAGVDAAEFWRSGALAAFGEYPGIEIAAEEYGEWSVADATNAMRAVLRSQSEIDGVWVGGLEMGVAVINAFNDAGREIPFIAGTNALNGFLRLAQENDVEFFVAPFPPGASQVCVDVVFRVLNGEPVQKFIDVQDEIEGTEPFGNDALDEQYQPDFNDEFIGPAVIPEEAYVEAGFGR